MKADARVTMVGGPRLHVAVGPSQAGPGAWQFTLERRSGDAWEWAGDYLTQGTREEVTLPVSAGTYRVVVPAQNGLPTTTSMPRPYVPTPDIAVGGHGALEVTVGPIRDWKVTLERQTDTGWASVRTVASRGSRPMVFDVGAGTYRVRTEANGRFPVFTGRPFSFEPSAPAGPIPYGMLDAAFSSAPAGSKGARSTDLRSSGGSNCGSVMTKSDVGVDIAVGVVNLVPYVGGALGSALDDWASSAQANAEGACLSGQFESINAQLAYQEAQIQQIQQELSQAKGAILQAFYNVDGAITNADLTAFTSDVNGLAQCSPGGMMFDFMLDFGFWNGCNSTTSVSVKQVATSSTFVDQSNFGLVNQGSFGLFLEGASGSTVKCGGGSARPQCWKEVYPETEQSSGALAEALAEQLATALKVNINAGENVVPLFDQYNNALVGYYEQSVIALQAAFTMETLINQLNYYNAGQDAPIDSLGLVPGTYYSYQDLITEVGPTPTASDQASYYNRAQYNLANVYAARMNQLYINTISFLVTDDVVGSQVWPSSGDGAGNQINAGIDYEKNVGRWVTKGSGAPKASTPLGMVPGKATSAGEWTSNAALYQYYGLRNAGTCYASLLQWNKNNGTAIRGDNGIWYPTAFPTQGELTPASFDSFCPPIQTTAAGTAVSATPTGVSLTSCATYASPLPGSTASSCYDGNTLAPYYVADGALPVAGSYVLNNLMLCNSAEPSLTWFQVGTSNTGNPAGLTAGSWGLTCGNWAAPGGPGFPGDRYPGSTPPLSWSDDQTYSCDVTKATAGTANPYCLPSQDGFWGPFYAYQNDGTDPIAYTYVGDGDLVVGSQYFTLQSPGNPAFVPNNAIIVSDGYPGPLDVGTLNTTTTMGITSPSCYSQGTTGASLVGCTLTFDPVDFLSNPNDLVAQAALAVLAVTLPSNAGTGSSTGGFVLPVTIGVAAGSPGETPAARNNTFCAGSLGCTTMEVWVSSNTSIGDVGYFAPASVVDPTTYYWNTAGWSSGQQITGLPTYITVADGSCWNMVFGRVADNQATLSFTQVPGNYCANS